MSQKSILIMLHCEQDTGYAIGPLEKTFEAAALEAGYDPMQILWSYTKVNTPSDQVFELGYYTPDDAEKLAIIHKRHNLDTILAFDLPYPTEIGRRAHALGIKNIVAYWGASMSSLNGGIKLLAKRAEWFLRRTAAPSRFIFESEAMRQTASKGRGVPKSHTYIIPLGVDTERYKPLPGSTYAHSQIGIPKHRKIVFFSGHMEERKGVRILVEAMNTLDKLNRIEPFHLLICGNKGNESLPYEALVANERVRSHITFAGYRDDIPKLLQSSFLGAIASTGWDSFTMSSIEMLASGLPLIVSKLQGLKETIDPGVCGEYINPGDFESLAKHILCYEMDANKYSKHSELARHRATTFFSNEVQIQRLSMHLFNDQAKVSVKPTKTEVIENHAPKGHI